ncbi:carotenoid oxygenase family protein [Piscinibacter sp. XHJ-5]|uniref:carotenoid oxygenase family protein n=1 Tax=Piscinibacter sp. XHJ-5 TaxID=3037797 RepID=UPI00245338E2|nr:carotenoid oxygenase family protein [Piscinibacter sp. XHJ-5]
MAKPFSTDHPFLNGYFAPLHLEGDASDLPISGMLPVEMDGTLYRIGPNPQFAPRGDYEWFAGDGMVHEFKLSAGRASYRNRYVRTPKWQLEHEAGEGLSAGTVAPSPLDDPRLAQLRSTLANTNIVRHGRNLLALEESHAPYALDQTSLSSLGYETFGGDLVGPMTAHPKIDPVSGEMIAFAYQTAGLGSRDTRVHVLGADGSLRRSERFMAPFASMMHDFAVTASRIILPVFPLTASIDRAGKGLPAYAWEPELGNHIGIMSRRDGVASMRWFRGEASYVFHVLNAYDTEDGKVVTDMVRYDVPPGYRMADGSPARGRQHGARLVRWTFDLARDDERYTDAPLSDMQVEFPRVDDRHALQQHRHGWFVSGSANTNVGEASDRASIAHIDTQTGATRLWRPQRNDFAGEPVFVPRSPGAEEGDGWIVTVVYRGDTHRSDLVVLEALDIARGPIATVHLSHHVPAGFHGNWYSAA